jgi:hypothetical protein
MPCLAAIYSGHRARSDSISAKREVARARGIPADLVPEGVHPATAMLASAQAEEPRRRSPLEDALSGGGLVYRRIQDGDGSS